jgi:hypothetical protein
MAVAVQVAQVTGQGLVLGTVYLYIARIGVNVRSCRDGSVWPTLTAWYSPAGREGYAITGKSGNGMRGSVLVASRLTLQDRRIRGTIGRLAELPGHIG